jgi:hypothetical protein
VHLSSSPSISTLHFNEIREKDSVEQTSKLSNITEARLHEFIHHYLYNLPCTLPVTQSLIIIMHKSIWISRSPHATDIYNVPSTNAKKVTWSIIRVGGFIYMREGEWSGGYCDTVFCVMNSLRTEFAVFVIDIVHDWYWKWGFKLIAITFNGMFSVLYFDIWTASSFLQHCTYSSQCHVMWSSIMEKVR